MNDMLTLYDKDNLLTEVVFFCTYDYGNPTNQGMLINFFYTNVLQEVKRILYMIYGEV